VCSTRPLFGGMVGKTDRLAARYNGSPFVGLSKKAFGIEPRKGADALAQRPIET